MELLVTVNTSSSAYNVLFFGTGYYSGECFCYPTLVSSVQ
jgi:hypothetical protein